MSLANDILKALDKGASPVTPQSTITKRVIQPKKAPVPRRSRNSHDAGKTTTPPGRSRVVSRGPTRENAADFAHVTAALRKLARSKPGKEWLWEWRTVHHFSNAELAHKQAQYVYNCARSVGVKATIRKTKAGLIVRLK